MAGPELSMKNLVIEINSCKKFIDIIQFMYKICCKNLSL